MSRRQLKKASLLACSSGGMLILHADSSKSARLLSSMGGAGAVEVAVVAIVVVS